MNITIIRAGVAGASTAISLARKGHQVTLFDCRTEDNLINAIANAIYIYPNASRVIDEYGLLQEFSKACSTTKQIWHRYHNGEELQVRYLRDFEKSYR
jgi:2-polyprenyl-6-methoxyphenol hydroxylase-like FAD-dependent oxidoreductase